MKDEEKALKEEGKRVPSSFVHRPFPFIHHPSSVILKWRRPQCGTMRVFLATESALLRDAIARAGHDALPPPPAAIPGVVASERQRFLASVDRMMEADMLVADATDPDTSVGWSAAWFLARGRLVVLLCRRDARSALAPMIAGNPSPWQRIVMYDAPEEIPALVAKTIGS